MQKETEAAFEAVERCLSQERALVARLGEVEAEAAPLPGRIASARTPEEVERLSRRRAEVVTLYGDLAMALQSTRRDREAAENAYAKLRLPEILAEREGNLLCLSAHLAAAIAPLLESSKIAAAGEIEIESLNPPAGVMLPQSPHLATVEGCLRRAFDDALGIDPRGVEVAAVRGFSEQADDNSSRLAMTVGDRKRFPPELAARLVRDGLVERVQGKEKSDVH